MRKLLTLTFALLFTAGIAFGQNNTTGYSTADLSDARTDVVNNHSEVGAYVDQVGDNNDADIAQLGNTNAAEIHQEGPGSEATIGQDGDDNIAYISQTVGGIGGQAGGNIANIAQDGTGNIAFSITNPGVTLSDHKTNITQTGNNNKAGQITPTTAGGNIHLSITQVGNGNKAGQIADGRYLFADIDQTGDDNKAHQFLVGDGSGVPHYWTHDKIIQDGNDNIALQAANAHEIGNLVIEQFGNNNKAFQYQGGSNYVADTFQNGNSNTATITQGIN